MSWPASKGSSKSVQVVQFALNDFMLYSCIITIT